MKALSLLQPWASLIAVGAKHAETRSWHTTYRGPIAIHASKGLRPDQRRIIRFDPRFGEPLAEAGYPTPNSLPTGRDRRDRRPGRGRPHDELPGAAHCRTLPARGRVR